MGTKAEYWKHRERYLATSRAYHKSTHGKRVIRAWWQRKKTLVLTHYGNGRCACVGCGFDDLRALSIDHINGGGTQHTLSLKIKGSKIYQWLINNNYPEGFQTLCMNCQWIKREENKEVRD